jgi:hypothetical protein
VGNGPAFPPDLQCIIELGDIAYNVEDDKGARGDNYFRAIEPITTRYPWMVNFD